MNTMNSGPDITPQPAAPVLAAAEWLTVLQQPQVPHATREAFVRWLRRSPVHVEEFLRLTALQAQVARWPGLASIDLAALGAEAARHGAPVVPLRADAEPLHASTRHTGTWRRLALAAAVLLTLAGVGAAWLRQEGWPATERYATRTGEQRSMLLADGSAVRLNVQSRLSARLDEASRDLRLEEGEALFQVAKDPQRPFRVRTPQALVEARGTEFNLHVTAQQTIVTLLEGRVEVSAAGQPGAAVVLDAGEQARVDLHGTPVVLSQGGADLAVAWTQGRLVFEDATLEDVVAQFNRYSRQPLVIGDPRLLGARITAVFDAGNVQAFADSLSAAGGLQVRQQPDGAWRIEARD